MKQEENSKTYGRAKKIHDEMKKNNKKSIYLFGGAGSGKTTIAEIYFKNYKRDKKKKKFLILTEYFDELLKEQAEKKTYLYKLDDLKKIDFLVIDDVGAEKYSEFREEVVYKIINFRYRENRPTIITSNLNLKELGKMYSERISSRINGMCFIAYTGTVDYRNKGHNVV